VLAGDCGRTTGKPEVIPADPIRLITSGWTTRDLSGSSILFKLLLRICALQHRHSADDVPILPVSEQGMRDAEGMRRAIAILVKPFLRDPVTRHRHVPIHLNRSRFKFNTLERQVLTGLRGNPVCYVVFVNRCSIDRGPAKEIFVPKT
jgi:hypothetical protein